jgi:hypothetical protein
LSYGEWSAKWWQWVLSIPKETNPATDTTGKDCAQNQEGPVWFLAGTVDSLPSAERECAVPAGRAILVPIITSEKSYAEFPDLKSESDLRTRAREAIDRVKNVEVAIDGIPVENIEEYRVQSPVFNLAYVENNALGVEPSTSQAVSDGYFIILEPLQPGLYNIRFAGAAFCLKDQLEFSTRVKYHLDVT